MKHTPPIAAAVVVALVAAAAAFAVTTTYTSTVTQIHTYTDYASEGGSLIFVADTPTNCDGFWLKGGDPGYEAALSATMTAYLNGRTVKFYVDEANTFPGSSDTFCWVKVVRLL